MTGKLSVNCTEIAFRMSQPSKAMRARYDNAIVKLCEILDSKASMDEEMIDSIQVHSS